MNFGFIKKMFIRLLSGSTAKRLGGSLAYNSEGYINYVSLNDRHVKLEKHFSI